MKFGQAYAVTTSLLALFATTALVGAALGIGALFTLGFVALAIVLPAGLVLQHLRREVVGNYRQGARDRTGMPVDVPRILRSKRVVGRGFFGAMLGLGAPMLALTALFFVVLPRFHAGPWSGWLDRGDRVHVSDAVNLHGDGPLVRDPSPALRFTVEGAPAALPPTMPMRFRGTVLDAFDGSHWRRSEDAERVAGGAGNGRAIRIERASFDPPGMLVPDGTIGVSSVERTGETSMTYVAWVGAGGGSSQARDATNAARARALGIPKALSPRLRALAHEWTEGATSNADKAKAIEAHLKSYSYDLASPARAAADPMDAFLFVEKRGHCELFASSMTVMLRSVGVPARMVTGLVGGTLNRFGGFYTVAQGDAHVWVEALVGEGDRWTAFDPTPTASLTAPTGLVATANDFGDAMMHRWAPNLLDFDATARTMLLSRPRVLVVLVFLLVFLLVARALLRGGVGGLAERLPRALRRRAPSTPSPRPEAAEIYAALERVLETHGIVRDASTPPLAHAESLVAKGHPLAGEILSLTRAYVEARFGARPLSPTEATSLRRRITLIRDSLPS